MKDSIRSFLARVGRPMWTVRSGVAREAQAMKKMKRAVLIASPSGASSKQLRTPLVDMGLIKRVGGLLLKGTNKFDAIPVCCGGSSGPSIGY